MRVCFATCCAILLFGLLGAAKGQGWRGIVPLHSTCEDAKRVLNITKCEAQTVELDDVTVFVNFSAGACQPEWNVRVGTVLTLDIRPKKNLTLADLRIDEARYSKRIDPRVPNTVHFNSEEDGVSIATFEDGRIRHLFYGPSSKDKHLRCYPGTTPSTGDRETGSSKFEQYGFLSFRNEVIYLNQFATTLAGWPGARGYIIIYPGRKNTLGQAQQRAVRAKSYLLSKRGINPDRIVTVIGGCRGEATVDLWITVKNGVPPILTPPNDWTGVSKDYRCP